MERCRLYSVICHWCCLLSRYKNGCWNPSQLSALANLELYGCGIDRHLSLWMYVALNIDFSPGLVERTVEMLRRITIRCGLKIHHPLPLLSGDKKEVAAWGEGGNTCTQGAISGAEQIWERHYGLVNMDAMRGCGICHFLFSSSFRKGAEVHNDKMEVVRVEGWEQTHKKANARKEKSLGFM